MTKALELMPPVHPAAELFPLLEGADLKQLVDDVRSNGLIEPVWLYDDPQLGRVLLDGRNRWRACEAAGVRVATRTYKGDDPLTFAISTNVKRRHMNEGQIALVMLDAQPMYEAQAEAAERRGGRPAKKPRAPGPAVSKARSRDRAAVGSGTSGRSIARAKRVVEQGPDLVEQVQAGKLALKTAERIVRDRQAEQRRVDQARAEAASQPAPSTVDIRHGDFREVLADLRDVDAVITDPPYPFEFLPLLEDLAAWADKVLTDDGVLAVLMGQTHLPEVFRLMDGHRPYRWTCAYLTPGQGYVSQARKMQCHWKPLILYGHGPRIDDVIRSEGTDAAAKNHHRWGQDYSAFHTIVERLTSRGQTIADPFMGSGTTLLAGHALGRNVIGADVDQAALATARGRLS